MSRAVFSTHQLKLLARKLSAAFARLRKGFGFLRFDSPVVKRGMLMLGAAVILLSGIGIGSLRQQTDRAQEHAPQVAEHKTPGQKVLNSTTTTATTQQNAAPTPAPSSATTPKPSTSGHSSTTTTSTAGIAVNAPTTTFRIGENSGTITVSTTDGSKVIWSIFAQYPSPIYITERGSYDASSSTTFKIGTNLPPSASPGTYTVTIDGIYSGIKPKLPTKVLTITLLPQEAIKIDVQEYFVFDESTGYTCTPYNIIELVSGVLISTVHVSAAVVSGDPGGISFNVTQPSAYTNLCIQLAPDVTLGERTIRATATYNGYVTTDDFVIDVVDNTPPPLP